MLPHKEILTFLLAALPITELRASIPIAVGVYHLSLGTAFLLSVAGNIFITFLLLLLLDPIAVFAERRIKWLKKILNWVFERTRSKTAAKYVKYGQWALVIFVAVPLPGTGAWTGAILAYLFNLPKLRAFLLISLGVIIAGIIVSLIAAGAFSGLEFFLR